MLLVTERALCLQLGLDNIKWASDDTRSNTSSGTTEAIDIWLGQPLSKESRSRWRGFVDG